MPLLGDKQIALIGRQTGSPYWGRNRLPLLGDKQVTLIGGQTGYPYLGNRQLALIEGDKQVACVEGQISGLPVTFRLKGSRIKGVEKQK